jgi:hypothetical protein
MRSDDLPILIEKDEVNFPNMNQQLVQAQQQALMDAQQDYYQGSQQEDSYGYFPGAGRYDENSMGPHGYLDRRQMKMPRGKYPLPNFDESQMVVLMVYGIDQINFDCNRLFNLLVCYGNVVKVSLDCSKLNLVPFRSSFCNLNPTPQWFKWQIDEKLIMSCNI